MTSMIDELIIELRFREPAERAATEALRRTQKGGLERNTK